MGPAGRGAAAGAEAGALACPAGLAWAGAAVPALWGGAPPGLPPLPSAPGLPAGPGSAGAPGAEGRPRCSAARAAPLPAGGE